MGQSPTSRPTPAERALHIGLWHGVAALRRWAAEDLSEADRADVLDGLRRASERVRNGVSDDDGRREARAAREDMEAVAAIVRASMRGGR